jgi:hypothetical protein
MVNYLALGSGSASNSNTDPEEINQRGSGTTTSVTDSGCLLKNMGLGSGIRDPEKTYSGSRIRVQGQKGTGSRIRNFNTDHNTGVNYKYSHYTV